MSCEGVGEEGEEEVEGTGGGEKRWWRGDGECRGRGEGIGERERQMARKDE